MSGGSMDYLCYKVEEASFKENTPERMAFAKHLKKIAKALQAIEWNDSGDGDRSEHESIMACISRSDVIRAATEEATCVRDELNALLNAASQPTSEGK